MKKVLVIAPHPDDETLGCGGTLFRHKDNEDSLHWLIITKIDKNHGWPIDMVKSRKNEIESVRQSYQFQDLINLNYPSTKLDTYPISDLVEKIGNIVKQISPEIIYIPFEGDIHSDHRIISKVSQSIIKWFRYPSIKKVLVYETISETNFSFSRNTQFAPNYFVDISNHLEKKIETIKIYNSELDDHPFPRSVDTIRSLAVLRGSQSGYLAAEAFQLIYQRK